MDAPPCDIVDTHCHLTFPDYKGRVRDVLDDARRVGVCACITISTDSVNCLEAADLAAEHENVYCSSGVHPLYSDLGREEIAVQDALEGHDWQAVRRAASHPKCVAFGELGLDNHYRKPRREVQDAVLAQQLEHICAWNDDPKHHLSRLAPLPIVIHCREATSDLLPVLADTPLERDRYVFHCFTGTPEEARAILDFGAWISFTGVVTYPNAPEVREAAKLVPLDRIMVETDAPFLSPVPHRGKRPCMPAYTADTARFLAELRGEPIEQFLGSVRQNTRRFFGI